jgi:hypothetical protein
MPTPKRKPIPKTPTILDAMTDPKIWGDWFRGRKSLLKPFGKAEPTWTAWTSFVKAMFGLPMDEAELALFKQCTGRAAPSPDGHVDTTLVIGRRGGKSRVLALIAAYLSVFKDWQPFLSPGERAHVVIIAADRRQAQSIFRYLKAFLTIHLFGDLVERETAELLELKNSVSVEVMTANFKTVRGRTVVAALLDELAFWPVDENSSNPDTEIVGALRPAMSTVPGAMMLKASSPYAKRGVLYEDYKKHFGRDSTTLVWQADTRTMNPTVPQSFIDEETEKDPAGAAAEYGAQFRDDLASFVPREVLERAVALGRYELQPHHGLNYVGFVDAAGGTGGDSFTMAIAHKDQNGKSVLDLVREYRSPFSPSDVIKELCPELKRYDIRFVTGDRWGSELLAEQFRHQGIGYKASDKTKSDLYLEVLPMLNSNQVELLDNQRLVNQFAALERRVARGGKSSVDHSPGAHDDVANAAAGALVNTIPIGTVEFTWASSVQERNSDGTTLAWGLPGEVPAGVQDALAWRRAQARGEVRPC